MQCSFRVVRQKLDTTPPIKVNNSVGTPSLNDLKSSDNTKNMSYDVDVQLVAIKAYFMNEIYELKREISQLKCQEKTSNSSESTLTDILKSQICISQEQNSFIKSEMQQKQLITEELLDINKSQLVVDQSSKEKRNPSNEHIGNTRNESNNNTRKKITVIGDSMLHLSKKGTQLLTENILRSLEGH